MNLNYKRTLFKNIDYLIAKECITVEELESSIEVKKGFLKKVRNKETLMLSTEVLSKISDYFNISTEKLLKENLSYYVDLREFRFSIIRENIEKTVAKELKWHIIDSLDDSLLKMRMHGNPLFKVEKIDSRNEGIAFVHSLKWYQPNGLPMTLRIVSGKIAYAQYSERSYLMAIQEDEYYTTDTIAVKKWQERNLWFLGDMNLCFSAGMSYAEEGKELIDLLFQAIEESQDESTEEDTRFSNQFLIWDKDYQSDETIGNA